MFHVYKFYLTKEATISTCALLNSVISHKRQLRIISFYIVFTMDFLYYVYSMSIICRHTLINCLWPCVIRHKEYKYDHIFWSRIQRINAYEEKKIQIQTCDLISDFVVEQERSGWVKHTRNNVILFRRWCMRRGVRMTRFPLITSARKLPFVIKLKWIIFCD